MLSRKLLGFMGTTWLGSMALLMSPIANAVIDLDELNNRQKYGGRHLCQGDL